MKRCRRTGRLYSAEKESRHSRGNSLLVWMISFTFHILFLSKIMSKENGVDTERLSRYINGFPTIDDAALFASVRALTDESTIRTLFFPHFDALVRAIDNLQYGRNKSALSHEVADKWPLQRLLKQLDAQDAEAQLVAARLLQKIVANGKTIGQFMTSIPALQAVAQAPVESPTDASSEGASDPVRG